ncbi:unnamed protein product [Laminaria digitata]
MRNLHSRAVAIRDALTLTEKNLNKQKIQDQDDKSRLNPGVVAIFCGKTQAAEICAVFGIVLSGGCFVPVDERLPAPRLREVMENARPGAIIVASRVLSPSSRPAWGGHFVGAVLDAWRQRGCLVINLEESGQLCEPVGGVSAPQRQAQLSFVRGDETESGLHHRVIGEMRPKMVTSAAAPAAVDAPAGFVNDGGVLGVPRPRLVDLSHRAERVEQGGASPIGRRGLPEGGVRTGTETAVSDPPRGEEGGDLLYILYTSGTTGVPKGVMGTRSGAANRIRFGWELCPFRDEGELVARRTPSCFVDFVAELFCPLLAGVPLFLAPDGAHADPLLLVPALIEARVTRITLTPSLLASLLRTADSYASPLLPDLHTWLVSGEALHPELALLFRDLTAPGTQLVNLYGSTEASEICDATYCTLDEIVQSGVPAAVSGGVLIGKSLPGVHLSVVGPDLLPVPAGQPGELLVGGLGVALGYHCRPLEAATKFLRSDVRDCGRKAESGVHIPGLEPGRRVFRTGDRVVQPMADGPLFWLGKLDGEVKVRGVRVSLEEVEILVCRATGLPAGAFSVVYDPGRMITSKASGDNPNHDGVEAPVATNDPDRGRLLGFFVLKGAPDATDGFAEMKRQMATEMTAAQLPAILLPVVGGFPLTSTGKIDKKYLLSEYRRSAGDVPEDHFPPTKGDTDTALSTLHHFASGTSRMVQGLATARAAIANAVVTVLPDARASFVPWLTVSAADQQEGHDLSRLTFDGVGGTSLLAVEAAWLASRNVAREGVGSTVPASASLLTAEDFLRGTLEGAASALIATLQAQRYAADIVASPGPAKDKGTSKKAILVTHPLRSRGPPAGSGPLLPAVQAVASHVSVQAPLAGRKRRRQAGNGFQEEKPRGFLAIGRAGVGNTQACLGETADPAGEKGGVVVARVELQVRWSSCLTKCIDASPLVVVPTTASRTVDRTKRRRSIEIDGPTSRAAVESTFCKGSLAVEADGPTSRAAVESTSCKDRVPREASGYGGQGTVYIGSHSGEFQALNLVTGEREWTFTAGGRVESGAACSFDGSTVFVGCHDRRLYALDRRTGALSWSFETGDAIKCTPLCVDLGASCVKLVAPSNGEEEPAVEQGLPLTQRTVLVGSHDGFLRCLSQAHGSLLWSLDCGGALFASPAYDADACVVYAATTKGHVFAVQGAALASVGVGAGSSATGADVKQRASGKVAREPVVVWKQQLPAPCFSTPAVCSATGNLVLGCVDGGLYCLSSVGEQLWVCRRGEKPVFSSPYILPCLWSRGEDEEIGRRVIWGSHDGSVRCGWDLNLAWETDIDKGRPVFSSPCFAAVACGRCTLLCPLVFACSVPGLISVLDLSSGGAVGEKQLPGEVFSSAVVAEKSLVVGCRDNRVYVLDVLATCASCAKAS